MCIIDERVKAAKGEGGWVKSKGVCSVAELLELRTWAVGHRKERVLRHNSAFTRRPHSVFLIVPHSHSEYNLCVWHFNGFLKG